MSYQNHNLGNTVESFYLFMMWGYDLGNSGVLELNKKKMYYHDDRDWDDKEPSVEF